ncbi:MAG: T9SS type A sorting domain-containing protein [Bacteroidetes bacterium]|nr:T9SS type A sorting domain-containing protein [Bacteroidota bacterium]
MNTSLYSERKQKFMDDPYHFKNMIPDDQDQFFYSANCPNSSDRGDYGNSPEWDWNAMFGGSGTDCGKDVIVDNLGNIYVVGDFSGNTHFGDESLVSTGLRDVFLAKFSPSGDLLWIRQLLSSPGGKAESFAICDDNNENLLITGSFSGDQLSYGDDFVDKIGTADIFAAKFNKEGGLIWLKNYGALSASLKGLKIQNDVSGYIYIAGSSTTIEYQSILLKADAGGQEIWRQYNKSRFEDLAVHDQNIYITGTLTEPENFGDTLMVPNGWNAFLAKMDLNGGCEWAVMGQQLQTGYGRSYATDMVVDDQGNIYFGGWYETNVSFGSINLTSNYIDLFITKADSSGNILWAIGSVSFHQPSMNDMHLCYDGRICFTGVFSHEIQFGDIDLNYNGTRYFTTWITPQGTFDTAFQRDIKDNNFTISNSQTIIYAGNTTWDVVICQTDFSGNESWRYLSSGDSGQASLIGIETDKRDGSIYFCGMMNGTVDFFGISYSNDIPSGFITKSNYNGEVVWTTRLFGGTINDYFIGNSMILNEEFNKIYIQGKFTDTLTIGDDVFTTSDYTSFLSCFTTEGIYKWTVIFAPESVSPQSVASDKEGNVIVAGLIDNGDDPMIAKYDSSGNIKWIRQVTGLDYGYTCIVSTDNDNNIYVTIEPGTGVLNFSDSIQLNFNDEHEGHVVLAKYNAVGDIQWAKNYGDSPLADGGYYSWPAAIKATPEGESYILGWHGDSASFGDILLRSPYSDYSHFIAKFDTDGFTEWVKSIQMYKYDLNYNEIDIDNENNCYIMSEFRDTIVFAGDDIQLVNSGKGDFYTARYNANSELSWVKTVICPDGSVHPSGIAVYDTNNLFVGGYFYNKLIIENDTLLAPNMSGFLVHIGDTTGNSGFTTYPYQNDYLKIIPNPSRGIYNIYPDNHDFSSDITLEVFSLTGKKILQHHYASASIPLTLDISTYPDGIYLVVIRNACKCYYGKIIKNGFL